MPSNARLELLDNGAGLGDTLPCAPCLGFLARRGIPRSYFPGQAWKWTPHHWRIRHERSSITAWPGH